MKEKLFQHQLTNETHTRLKMIANKKNFSLFCQIQTDKKRRFITLILGQSRQHDAEDNKETISIQVLIVLK